MVKCLLIMYEVWLKNRQIDLHTNSAHVMAKHPSHISPTILVANFGTLGVIPLI